MLEKARAVSWNTIEADSGLLESNIRQVGEVIARSKATIACWAMGLTQQPNGVSVIQVVNLLLLGGHVGRPGAAFVLFAAIPMFKETTQLGIWEALIINPFAKNVERIGYRNAYGARFSSML